MPKKRSLVWLDEFFKNVTVILIKAECHICMLRMSIEAGGGTSSLFRHLKIMHKATFEDNYLPKKRDEDEKGKQFVAILLIYALYPNLATIARCYLALRSTSVPSD